MKIRFLLAFVAFAMVGTLQAQDIHYTLFNMSPLTMNPALTGAYPGTARVGGIYRDQWASVVDDQFKTPSFFIDAPIIRGFREQDWVGVGGVIINDEAGVSNLRTNYTMFSASYHLGLDEDLKNVLTLGVQGGGVERKIDRDRLRFGEGFQYAGGFFDYNAGLAGDGNNIRDRVNYIDFAVGLMFRSRFDEKSNLEVGAAVSHLTQPDYGLAGGNRDDRKRPMRISVHSTYNTTLTDKWSLSPTLLFQTTGGATEIIPQVWGGYQIKEDIKLNFGVGYRFGDAANLLLGMDIEDLRVALSYDINTSSLTTVSDYQGGFELAAYYILKIYKQPDVKPAILCPQL